MLAREQPRLPGQGHEIFSDIYLSDPFEKLPIADQYKDFVRKPTGIIERLFGHPVYMMELSRRIVGGESWKLGAFAAHALLHEDRLAQRDEPYDSVIWLTGGVSRDEDLAVESVGHVQQKLEQSVELIRDCRSAEIPIELFMPAEDFAQLDPDWLESWRSEVGADGASDEDLPIHAVASAFELGPILELPELTSLGASPERGTRTALAASAAAVMPGHGAWSSAPAIPDALPAPLSGARPWRWAVLFCGAAALLLLLSQQEAAPPRAIARVPVLPATIEPSIVDDAPARPDAEATRIAPPAPPPADDFGLEVEARVLANGRNCALYGAPESIETRTLARTGSAFAPAPLAGLCSTAYRVHNRGERPLHVWIQIVPLASGPRFERQRAQGRLASATIARGDDFAIEIQPPTFGRRGTRYRVFAAAAYAGSDQVDAVLPTGEAAIDADWATIEEQLEAMGVAVDLAIHEVQAD